MKIEHPAPSRTVATFGGDADEVVIRLLPAKFGGTDSPNGVGFALLGSDLMPLELRFASAETVGSLIGALEKLREEMEAH